MHRKGLICLLLLVVLTGCGRAPVDEAPPAALKPPMPGGVRGTGWHIPWQEPDPKRPGGPPHTVFIADASDGEMTDPADNLTLYLNDVRAKLFRAGKHAADLYARHIVTDRSSRIVHATGNVRIVSLTDPPDLELKADRMTWDTRTSRIMAEGNASAVQKYRDGRPPNTTFAPRILLDTATGDIKTMQSL